MTEHDSDLRWLVTPVRRIGARLKGPSCCPGAPWGDVTLGEAEEGELLAIQTLMAACIGSWAPSLYELQELYLAGRARIFVARRKHPLGFVMAGPSFSPGEAAGAIYSLGVQQRFRRRGLGRALLAAAEGWLAGTNVRTIRVRVPDGSPGVLTFFREWGYTLDEVTVGFYGHRRDGLILVKDMGCDPAPGRLGSSAAGQAAGAKKDSHV